MLACALLLPSLALANGRFPAANQLVKRPGQPHYLLRATFGLLLTEDDGKNWDWVCEQALGYSSNSDPAVAYSENAIFVATSNGVYRSSDRRCDWSLLTTIPHANVMFVDGGSLVTNPKFFSDVTVPIDKPKTIFALQSSFREMSGLEYDNILYQSDDDGASWRSLYTFDPTRLTLTIEVGGSKMPDRIYVTATHGLGVNNTEAFVYVSDDGGKSFTPRKFPLDAQWLLPDGGLAQKETGAYIAGVDPSNPDRIYVRTNSGLENPFQRLLVSEDAGQTWKVIFTGKVLAGFAMSSDGSKIWVGGPQDGLNVASRTDFMFQKLGLADVQCLAMFDSTLWVCSKGDPFALGRSTDEGKTFTSVLALDQIRGQMTCAAGSLVPQQCTPYCPGFRDLVKANKDACPPTAVTPEPTTMPKGGCGCGAAPAGSMIGGALLALLVGFARRLRKRV